MGVEMLEAAAGESGHRVSHSAGVFLKRDDPKAAVCSALAEFNASRPFISPAGQDLTSNGGVGAIEQDPQGKAT
jgi:hypothetical protein